MGAREDFGGEEIGFVEDLWNRFFRPKVAMSVDEWADAHRMLPAGSAEAGKWRTDRTPYARQIYRDLSDDAPYEDVVLMCATQLVKSEAGLNWLGAIIDLTPGPIMIVQPTIDLAMRYSKERIAPMIAATPALRAKVKESRTRDSGNTTKIKEFPGGRMVITGANSAAGLASMPARFLHFDERDDYPDDADGQGDPTLIATARQDTFRRRKRLTSSSPKRAKGISRIEQEFDAGTRFRYHVPCPHCGEKQVLRWAGIVWNKDPEPDPETARYACEHCGALIDEHHKNAMLAGGEWIAENPAARVRSYHLSSLYSPYGWLSWPSLARQWLNAQRSSDAGDNEPLKTFVNTRLAETWAEQAEEIASNDLKAGAETFDLGTMPLGALVPVATVDVQDDRFEVAFWAFGEGDQSWLFDFVVLQADPGVEDDWRRLDALLDIQIPHESGHDLPIRAIAIDTGGHHTHAVYQWVRKQPGHKRVAAIKGGDRPSMPIYSGKPTSVDVNVRGGVIKGGAKLWHVGVHTAKDLLYARLKKPGKVHLCADLPESVFEQLTAEHRVKSRTARGLRYVWKPRRAGIRNEAWDLGVYAIWCAERLGLSKWTPSVWASERAKVTGGAIEAPSPLVKPRRSAGPAEELEREKAGTVSVSPPIVPETTVTVTVETPKKPLFRPRVSTDST